VLWRPLDRHIRKTRADSLEMKYSVFLEINPDGRTLAHVLELAGCISRADSRQEALQRLPGLIHEYHAWLRGHGEATPAEDVAIDLQIAGESSGYGPFDPGNAAALLPDDPQPVARDELEYYLALAAYGRADLLGLLCRETPAALGTDGSPLPELPDDLLDWQPAPHSFSLRRVLRHIGNAEEWYVSRLVSPETLPAEWEHDEDLPLLQFLAMERRTAVDRLRRLTDDELSRVVYPSQWTDHPEEPWTARKALRRLIEHEREHTAQVREILAARRGMLDHHKPDP